MTSKPGHVKFAVEADTERSCTISIITCDEKTHQAHLGFLQVHSFENEKSKSFTIIISLDDYQVLLAALIPLHHRYEIRFPLKLSSSASAYQASPQPSLLVKKFEAAVSKDCEEQLDLMLEILPYKTKLLREKVLLKSSDDSDTITITLNARVLGPGQGTPSLLRGVKLIGVESAGDSEVSDWKGFD